MNKARCLMFLVLVTIPVGRAAFQTPAPVNPTRSTWPMYGGSPGRNMANFQDRGILGVIDPQKGLPLLWKADLGSRSYAQPDFAGIHPAPQTCSGQKTATHQSQNRAPNSVSTHIHCVVPLVPPLVMLSVPAKSR